MIICNQLDYSTAIIEYMAIKQALKEGKTTESVSREDAIALREVCANEQLKTLSEEEQDAISLREACTNASRLLVEMADDLH